MSNIKTYEDMSRLASQVAQEVSQVKQNTAQFGALLRATREACSAVHRAALRKMDTQHFINQFINLFESALQFVKTWNSFSLADKLHKAGTAHTGDEIKELCHQIGHICSQTTVLALPDWSNLWRFYGLQDRAHLAKSLEDISESEEPLSALLQLNEKSLPIALANFRDMMIYQEPAVRVCLSKIAAKLSAMTDSDYPLGPQLIASQDINLLDLITSKLLFTLHRGLWQGAVEVNILSFQERVSQAMLEDQNLVWANLHHPNVLELYGVRLTSPPFLVVTPRFEEGQLMQYLASKPDTERIRIATELAEGIAYLHSQSVVHADIRTSNVFVDETGSTKVINFAMSALGSYTVTWTPTMTPLDNDRYHSPERIARGSLNNASDVYSLGVVVWEILTSRFPYEDCDEDQAVHQIATGNTLPRPDDTRIPPSFWDFLQSLWHFEAHRRPCAAEVARRLAIIGKEM